ncbi:MAG TPA: hypothetical protein DIU00_11525 [Phycisphaerales bacterium]|nr:hypothetical protein [Phycisphaerales bacterium]
MRNDKSAFILLQTTAAHLLYKPLSLAAVLSAAFTANEAKKYLLSLKKKVKSQENSSDNYTVGGMRKRVWG